MDNFSCECAKGSPHAPLLKKKLTSFGREATGDNQRLLASLIAGQELLAARVETLELRLDELFGLIDRPMSPKEIIAEIQRLRSRISA